MHRDDVMETVLITLLTQQRQVDLEVSATLAISKLLPQVLDACNRLSGGDAFPATTAWSLYLDSSVRCAPHRSLADYQVVDGARVYLLASSLKEEPSS